MLGLHSTVSRVHFTKQWIAPKMNRADGTRKNDFIRITD
jgi:hypothetical protein